MSGPEAAARPHVLVVDDLEDNRNLLVQLLADGYRVTTASDGREALAAIAADRPDLLLLDLMMPVLDGFGVLAHLQDAPTPFLPVIVLTASNEQTERLRALRSGAHEFLTKPVDDEELDARIATLLALKRARDEAEQAAAFRRLFLATMSHEIRTPLTSLLGFAELLQELRVSPEQTEEAHRTILRSGRHLLRIVNDVLDLSRLEAGEVIVERRPCLLSGILDDLESALAPLARERGLDFVVERPADLPATVTTDATRVGQILLNLAGNAIKFTARGGVRIEVGLDAETERLRFAVHDTGIGLTMAQLGKLFRPYAQAEADTSRKFGGTGLGLYISRLLAEALGGTLGAASQPGVGSVFELRIDAGPLAPAGWTDAGLPASADAGIPSLEGARVLLAEDTPTIQRLIAHYVRQAGASVAVVDDGDEAVEEALAGDYDLVLMDMQMPRMGGMEATRLLREAGFARPIVALTADVLDEDVAGFLEAGCTACLAKPVDRARFFEVLAANLQDLAPGRAASLFEAGALAAIAADYAAELPDEVAAICAAADAEAWPTARALAHRVRGTAASLGFEAVGAAAEALELALRAGRIDEARAAARALARTMDGGEPG